MKAPPLCENAVRNLFRPLAPTYDRLNHLLSAGLDILWRHRAVRLLLSYQKEPKTLLDLATGTGDFALALASQIPHASLIALDLTPEMLSRACEKIASAHLEKRVTCVDGSALQLPFANAQFDAITCGFGFRNFPDQTKALQEAARVLKPKGLLVVLEFFRPSSHLIHTFIRLWVKFLSALFVSRHQDAYTYLTTSMTQMCTRAEFCASAESSGLACLSHHFFFPVCSCVLFRKK